MVNREIAIDTAKLFVKDCEKSGISFKKVMLFGSAASNSMHEDSDIDLLLISDQFTDNPFENLKLYSKVNIKYPRIETHSFSSNAFFKGNSFIDDVKNNAIEIV